MLIIFQTAKIEKIIRKEKLGVLKGLRFLGAIFGDFGECGYYRDFGESPIIPSVPIVPFINLSRKRTLPFSFHSSPHTFAH